MRSPTRIVFVCSNICRSLLAEGVMRHLVRPQDRAIGPIDSAGTGVARWRAARRAGGGGESPRSRSRGSGQPRSPTATTGRRLVVGDGCE